jgi:molybdate transport system regulatory protein
MRPQRNRSTKSTPGLALDASLWLTMGADTLGSHTRMALLRAITEQGSITQAAKAIGMSYKAAWDAVDAMNNLAGEPLVQRSAGGKGGGSTLLTPRGARLLERYEQLDAVHRRFVQMLGTEALDLQADFNLLRTLNMKTSARNQYTGTITAVRAGAVNDEVELTLAGGARITATITRESSEAMGLRPHMEAFALVMASSVVLATHLEGAKLSARNQLPGVVRSITPGAVNAEVLLEIAGGNTVAAMVTMDSVRALGLAEGVSAVALFKAPSVILGVMV